MAATDASVKQLQLQISASTELLIRNLKQADATVADFRRQTDKNLDQIDGRFAALGYNIGSTLRGALGGVAGLLGGGALIKLASDGLDYASSLGEVAQQLGVTTTQLQTFRYAATQVGIDQADMDKGLSKLTLTIGQAANGSKKQASAFNELGINVRTAGGEIRTAGDIIPQLADALAKIESPAERARIEVELFGKTGQKLDTLLAGGSKAINELTSAAEQMGLVISPEFIQRADDAADRLAAIKTVLSAQVAGVVAENADAILILANTFATLATNAGQAIVATRNFFALKSGDTLGLMKSASGRAALLDDLNVQIKQNQQDRVKGRGNRTSRLGGLLETTTKATPADTARLDAEFKLLVQRRNAILDADRNASTLDKVTPPAVIQAAGLNGLSGGGKPKTPKAKAGPKPKSIADRLKEDAEGTGSYVSSDLAAAGSDAQTLVANLGSVDTALAGIRTGLEGVNLGSLLSEDEQRRLEYLTQNFQRDLTDGLADAVFNGANLGDVLVTSIQRASAELLSSGLLDLLQGGIGGGGGIGGIFGSAKKILGFANGGTPPVGRVSIVGERGPELFIPKVSGTIIPNHALSGGGTTVHNSFDLRGALVDRDVYADMQRIAGQAATEAAGFAINHTNDMFRQAGRPGL